MSTQTMLKIAPVLMIDRDRCSYCGACVAVCLPDCLLLLDATLTVDLDQCTRCQRCVSVCPTGALTIETLS